MGFLDFLKGSVPEESIPDLKVDVHSHLLPGIDDGAKTMEESISLIRAFSDLGYRHLITTPHIMQDYYANTPEIILKKLEEVRAEIQHQKIDVLLDAAAEYYLDEFFIEKIKSKETLLTFADNHILFEMSFMSESPFLKECIFLLRSAGYIPVLAHVERYSYYFKKWEDITDLMERGCLLQINLNSLVGYYGKPSQQLAQKLIDAKMVHLVGSDCHNLIHMDALRQTRRSKYFAKALNLPLINYSISPK